MTTRRSRYRDLTRAHPDVVEAYERLRAFCESAGPLDPQAAALIRRAITIGRGSSRSVHAHAGKALEAGASPNAVLRVAPRRRSSKSSSEPTMRQPAPMSRRTPLASFTSTLACGSKIRNSRSHQNRTPVVPIGPRASLNRPAAYRRTPLFFPACPSPSAIGHAPPARSRDAPSGPPVRADNGSGR